MRYKESMLQLILIPIAIPAVTFTGCLLAYTYNMEYALWAGMLASFFLTVFGILKKKKETNWLLIIVAFAISMRIPSLFLTHDWGFGYPMRDSALDMTLSNLILESGKWTPGMGFDVIVGYSYYPILHIFTAMISSVLGVEVVVIARIFPFIATPLVTIFFYLALRKFVSIEVAIWASLIYNLNGYWHFWEFYVREFMALIFFSMVIYFVFSMYKSRENRNNYFFLGVLAAFMVVSSHHWSSYNLVAILAVLAVFPLLYARVTRG